MKSEIKTVIVFAILLFGIILIIKKPVFTGKVTYYVSSSGGNYSTITECLNAINNTDENNCVINQSGVHTINGSYYYNVSDTFGDGIVSFNVDDVTIDCNGSQLYLSAGGYLIKINKNNITISNCILNSTSANYLAITISSNNSKISNNTFGNFYSTAYISSNNYSISFINNTILNSLYGVYGGFGDNSIISNNLFDNEGSFAINSITPSQNIEISNNTIINSYGGITQYGTIKNNYLENISYVGITSQQSDIINNIIKNTNNIGIYSYLSNVINNTFINVGNVSTQNGWYASYSPLVYNNIVFNGVVRFFKEDLSNFVDVSSDDTIINFVDGTKNFDHLWLYQDSNNIFGVGNDANVTVYCEGTCSGYTCAAVVGAYGGVCHYALESGAVIANGSNYYWNQSIWNDGVSVNQGTTDPPYLENKSFLMKEYYDIEVYEVSNITGNIIGKLEGYDLSNFPDSQKKGVIDITSGSNYWLNHFYMNLNATSINACVNGEGNFYEESLIPHSSDCGQINVTYPTNGTYNETINMTWTRQSSPYTIHYDVFANRSNNNSVTFINETTNLFYLWNISSVAKGNYTIKVIPWIVGSRINATADTSEQFAIQNHPPIVPELSSPADNDILLNRTPTFSWSSSDVDGDIITYNLLVDNDSDFSSPEINTTQPQNSYTPPSDMSFGTYNWKVNAYDGSEYSGWSSGRNFTIILSVACSLPINSVTFGTIMSEETKDTTTNNPPPLIVENGGNVKLNISLNATNIWQSVSNPSDYYKFKVGVNESNSFESATVLWTNIPESLLQVITQLKYQNENDDARIDIRVTSPPDEGAGQKSSNISVWCEVGE